MQGSIEASDLAEEDSRFLHQALSEENKKMREHFRKGTI